MKSILQDDKACFVCGTIFGLHRHHVFYGAGNRAVSERDGCWCYLCAYHHNLSDKGVHFNKDLDLRLKRRCQEIWEETYGDRESFIRRYGKSYL